jgi:hypothetical protein
MIEPIVRDAYRRTVTSDKDGMSLPPGKTCGDCVHINRCTWLIDRIPADEVCDWSPIRFAPRKEAPR